jgi:hypothetical protein
MTNEQIIADFLKPPSEGGAYTDEKLAALLAHCENGGLSFWSCCCFAGIPSAQHPLRGRFGLCSGINESMLSGHEEVVDRALWGRMSSAFCGLADTDRGRRARLIPLIKVEVIIRESVRAQSEMAMV